MIIPDPDSTVPLVETSPPDDHAQLVRRKGGGGHGSSGHSSGKGGGSESSGGKGGGSSAAKAHGASSSFTNSRGGSSSISLSTTKTSASAYSDGGGKPSTLGSSSVFSGRLAGGGSRTTIYGTSRFGSGYPYGGYGVYVDNRPFPYQFYPAPVSYNYYGSNEYLNVNSTERPGGNLVSAIVQPSFSTSSVTYRLVGDNASVIAVFDALVANCSVSNSSSAITAFNPSPSIWPLPEQVIQYYRASTFALSLDSYNNTAALLSNAPASNDSTPVQIPDTSLPSGLNMTFLECVNSTIGASVPLEDISSGKKLSGKSIAEIVIGGIIGVIALIVLVQSCCCSDRYEETTRKREKRRSNLRVSVPAPKINVSQPVEDHLSDKEIRRIAQERQARHISSDERTLAADSIGDKKRWSVATSGASSSTEVNSNESYNMAKMDNKSRKSGAGLLTPTKPSSSWLTKIPIVGHKFNYRSVRHQSTSSIDLPLNNTSNLNSRSASPSPFPSPSLLPYTPTFPLAHYGDERSTGKF